MSGRMVTDLGTWLVDTEGGRPIEVKVVTNGLQIGETHFTWVELEQARAALEQARGAEASLSIPEPTEQKLSLKQQNFQASGWGKSLISRKRHYFPAGDCFSLCRGIGFYFGERDDSDDGNPDNCVKCRKLRVRS